MYYRPYYGVRHRKVRKSVNHWGRRQLVYERDYTYGAPQITVSPHTVRYQRYGLSGMTTATEARSLTVRYVYRANRSQDDTVRSRTTSELVLGRDLLVTSERIHPRPRATTVESSYTESIHPARTKDLYEQYIGVAVSIRT
jgi:hypothetical protein